MERLDKIIASQGKYSRSEVKKLVRSGRVTVDGEAAKSADMKLEASAAIAIDGKELICKKHIYIMLNKPQGVISATEDRTQKTVLDLVPKELFRNGYEGKLIFRTDNCRYTGNLRNLPGRSLAVTAHYQHNGIGIGLDGAADKLTGFPVAFRGYGAGIYNVNVAPRIKGKNLKSHFFELLTDCLGFVL